MEEGHIIKGSARGWPAEAKLLDTQMGYMYDLQGMIYQLGKLAMAGALDKLSPEMMMNVGEDVSRHIDTWEMLHSAVLASLREYGSSEKVATWRATASGVRADMEECIEAVRAAMRGM